MPEQVVAGPQGARPGGLGLAAQIRQLGERIAIRRCPVDRRGPSRDGVLDERRQDEPDGPEGLGWSYQGHTAWYPRVLRTAATGADLSGSRSGASGR